MPKKVSRLPTAAKNAAAAELPHSAEVSVLKIRIKFAKKGPVKFIGHLDTMRFFQKLIRRADIPVAYSEGYSPHQKMSFAQALSVGAESEGEYFDLELKGEMAGELSFQAIIDSMNRVTVEGIEILDCVKLPEGSKNAMASVYAADYLVRQRPGHEYSFDISEAVDGFNKAGSVKIIKKTKKSEKELELKDLVYELRCCEEGLFMKLCASSAGSIKPALLMDHFRSLYGLKTDPLALMITRLEIYDEEMKPLSSAGSHF